MRPQVLTQTATGTSAWIPMDFRKIPFNLGLQCVLNSGTATFNVEYTMDEIWTNSDTGNGTTIAAFVSPISAATTSTTSNIAFPVRAVRLNITAGSTPNLTFTALQGSGMS